MACVLSCVLAFSLCFPPDAAASVLTTDVIAGQTVEEHGYESDDCPNIEARYAIAVDEDGNVIYERSGDDAAQIASITKIMTAIVVLDYDGDLSLEVTVTEESAAIGESSAGLQEGDVMDMETALQAMMIASGNDAAQAIAATVGAAMLADEGEASDDEDTCVARFVKAMNKKAKKLGLEDTVFTNPHGLDYDEYEGDLHSTASDVAKEVAYAMQNETFRDIVCIDETDITVQRDGENTSISLTSTDELLDSYEGTIGVKTGYTELAGGCYAGANERDGKTYYVVVLNSTDESTRFTDATAIWDWIYENTIDYQLINAEEEVTATIDDTEGTYPIVAEVAHQGWIDRTVKATVADPDMTVELYTWNGNVSQSVEYDTVTGNVRAGDKVGTITFKQHNEVIATVDLIAAEDVDAPGLLRRIGIFWQRLISDFNDSQTVADSVLLNDTPLIYDKTGSSSS